MLRCLLLIAATVCFVSVAFAQIPATIYEIQYTTDPSGDSPLLDQAVTTSGVVTAVHYDGFLIYDGAAPWQAVFVYDFTSTTAVGDDVTVTGTVQEYFGMTEIVDVTSFAINSHGNPVTPGATGVKVVLDTPL